MFLYETGYNPADGGSGVSVDLGPRNIFQIFHLPKRLRLSNIKALVEIGFVAQF